MLNIDQQISIEGRITEFQMEYIKSKYLTITKEGSSLSMDSQTPGNNMSKLKEDQKTYLKQKVQQMETMQIQAAHKYTQQICMLEALLAQQDALAHQIKLEIMEMKADISEFSGDIKTISKFIANKYRSTTIGSPTKKDKRNTYSPTINQQKKQFENPKVLEAIKEQPKTMHRKTFSCGNLALSPQRISAKLQHKWKK